MPQEGETRTNPNNPDQKATFTGGKWREVDAAGFISLGDGMKRDPLGRIFHEGPRGGLARAGGPNDTMINDATKAALGANDALAGIDRVDTQLAKTKDIGPLGWITNPKDIAVLEQSVKDLQLKLKEKPYNLGVLNGPDLDLLESIVANPGKLKSAAFRQTIAPRLANLASVVGATYRNEAAKFQANQGNPDALQPLYQSPRSQYSKEEWGRQGRVPALKGAAPKGQPAKTGGYKILSVE